MVYYDKSPIIGVVVGVGPKWRNGGDYYRSYAGAVEAAGAKCVALGWGRRNRLSDCSGLLITGGWDVHPGNYDRPVGSESLSDNEFMAAYSVQCESRRDSIELRLLREAIAQNMPVLGICRGHQSINIVMGHKLLPDIASFVPNALFHRSLESEASSTHEIEIEPDSIIGRCYGANSIIVNSRHHQGLTANELADGLRATAFAPDGIVESFEGINSTFLVGVQWHPERVKDPYIHDRSKPLFEAFVQACEAFTEFSQLM